MELLDRYLQAVRKYLPARRQDDIIAELRANMESQIEDKESELGRPLTQGEMEDLLRKMGSPVIVASRYQPQQYLIGPTLFPMYLYVLRIVVMWALIVYRSCHQRGRCPFITETVPVADSLMRMPGVLINVAAWVTLVFAAFEFFAARYPESSLRFADLTDNWNPSSLPPVEKPDARAANPLVHSGCRGSCHRISSAGMAASHPCPSISADGTGRGHSPRAPYQLAPVWWTFYWWIIGLNVLQLAWKTIDLARGQWQQPAAFGKSSSKTLGVIPIALLLSLRDHVYVVLKNPTADQASLRPQSRRDQQQHPPWLWRDLRHRRGAACVGYWPDHVGYIPPSRSDQIAGSGLVMRAVDCCAPLDTDSTLADEGARIGGYMRRLITYFNSLFLGMILGMIFVAIVHTCPTHRSETQNRDLDEFGSSANTFDS